MTEEQRLKNKEKNRKYRAANLEKIRENARKRYADNPEKMRENARKRHAANPEKKREYARKRYADNPEKMRERARKWYAANTEKQLLYAIKHRSREGGIDFNLTVEDLVAGESCPSCGSAFSDESKNTKPSVDKVIPSRGYVKGNVVVICGACNRRKQDATPEQLEQIVAYIRRHQE